MSSAQSIDVKDAATKADRRSGDKGARLMPHFVMLPREANELSRPWVYRILLHNILHLFLPPGSPLVETEVREYFDVSRTPIREAFAQLAQEDFIQIVPQKGTYVTLIDMARMFDLRYIRRVTEVDVAREAAKRMNATIRRELDRILRRQERNAGQDTFQEFMRADNDLHRAVFEAAGKLRVWEFLNKTMLHYYRMRILALRIGRRQACLLEEHVRIVDALKKGDPDAAAREVSAHLAENVWRDETLLKNYRDYLLPKE